MSDVESFEHPAFGMLEVSRVSGTKVLFAVDHPQHHYITLKLSEAQLNRRHGTYDSIHSTKVVAEVSLSSVQWANLLSSMNAGGVPCTFRYRHDPSGKFIKTELEADYAGRTIEYGQEVKARAADLTARLKEALNKVEAMSRGGPVRKSEVAELEELLQAAHMSMNSNLPYVVETAARAIDNATERAKAEVSAFVDHSMIKLGERALGDRLAQAIDQGVDVGVLGHHIAGALAPPENADEA